MDRSKAGTKKLCPKGLNYSSGLSSPARSLGPETVDELIYTYSPSTTTWRDNINKHDMEIFYKTWKKCNEIQLIKNKVELNK